MATGGYGFSMKNTPTTLIGISIDSALSGGESPEDRHTTHALMGMRLREARQHLGLGVRELARQLDLSASLVSQIELGRVAPSVSTLYALTNALGVSMDSLFADEGTDSSNQIRSLSQSTAPPDRDRTAQPSSILEPPSGKGHALVQRKATRRSINLEAGVRWELLTPSPEQGAEFLEVQYEPRSGARPADGAIRHNGRDYCLVLEGSLWIQVGFEQFVLEPGDSIAFESTIPHYMWNEGPTRTRTVWFVLDRMAPGRKA
jgi:transcriptional regulator with XRE-family HTH domain